MSLYTSRSEFDLEKRIQFTNEIPPYDMFGGLNSVLQTDLWKWVLGYTDVEFGLPYTIDTLVENKDGTTKIVQDRDLGIDNGEVYYKMVNGKLVDDVQYGPSPESNSTFHRLEEYGVLLPEFDFLLHEVYRYLGSVYPNHPDMIYLLTENEFDDMLANAAALIDYEPNNKFFDVVSSTLGLSESDTKIEAAMMKIRNLNNEGFRKGVYGSKLGYRMLSNDIFQTASIFPVATYLPIKPVNRNDYILDVGKSWVKDTDNNIISLDKYNDDISILEEAVNNSETEEERVLNQKKLNDYKNTYKPCSPMVDVEQLKIWNETNGYSYDTDKYNKHIRQYNRKIDTYSKLYNKKLRLIDLDGSNSSYPEPEDPNEYSFGYTIPFNEMTIYEVPACSDVESHFTNFPPASTISTIEYDSTINYVNSINTDIPLKEIKYDYINGTFGNNTHVDESVTQEVHNITTSLKNSVPFRKLYVYPKMKDIELEPDFYNAISKNGVDTFCNENKSPKDMEQLNFLTTYYSTYGDAGFTKDFLKTYIKEFEAIYNPLIKDTLITSPSNTISFYPESVQLERKDSKFYISQTGIVWDCIERFSYVSAQNLAELNVTVVNATAQVTNFTKGYIDILIDESQAFEAAQVFDVRESTSVDDRYGLVVKNENGELIVLEGKLTVETMVSAGRYIITSEHFDIAAIPKYKTTQMLKLIYGSEYTTTKAQLEPTAWDRNGGKPETIRDYIDSMKVLGYDEDLGRMYYSDDDSLYSYANNKIKESKKDYTVFLSYVKKLIELEEKISNWKKNRENLYKNVTLTKGGETIHNEESLVLPGCEVVYILGAGVPIYSETEEKYKSEKLYKADGSVEIISVPNEDYYQNNVAYDILGEKSGYLNGKIKNIYLGNLNVVSIYGINNSVQYISTNKEVLESTIQVTSTNKNDAPLTFKYLTVDENIIEHDNTTIYDTNNVGLTIKDYYKQSISNLDDNLRKYTMYSSITEHNNLIISPVDRSEIQIESVIDVNTEGKENIITFESDYAREVCKSLSVGDLVTGPSIDTDDNDVFITKVGDNEVTVNVKLQQSGTFLLNYHVKTNTSPADITDNLMQYKEDLYKNGLYSVTNPFEHGLWPSEDFPNVSTAVLDSLPDISFYNIHNYTNGKHNSFTTILEDTHYDEFISIEKDENDNYIDYLMPSDIKFNNELFLEFNLNKLIKYHTVHSNTTPILMSVEWLDYIENSLMNTSRATDNVNVGVNLMLETDTTGYYSMIENMQYTDPQINLKFITLNLDGQNMMPEKTLADNDWITPCYAQVGKGGSGRRNWFKSLDNIKYPNIWGIKVYDDVKNSNTYDETSDFYQKNGELRDVNVYGQALDNSSTKKSSVRYTSVEDPLFEIPLGEYDTVTKYTYDSVNTPKNLLSITQASFYSQTFTNIIKYFDDVNSKIKIIGSDVSKNNILISYGSESSRNFTYAGVWNPTKSPYYDNGVVTDYFLVNYPDNPKSMTYYVVDKDISLGNIAVIKDGKITGQETKAFSRSDVLFRFGNYWYLKSFQYLGLLGDGLDQIEENVNADKEITYDRVKVSPEANKAVSEKSTNGKRKNGKTYYCTLVERLIQYYLRASNIQPSSYYTTIVNNLKFNEPFYKDADDESSAITLVDMLKDFKGIPQIHKDHILYWVYAGTFSPDENDFPKNEYWTDTRNRDWLKEELENGKDYGSMFEFGDRLALVNFNPSYSIDGDNNNTDETDESQWYVFKVNTNSLLGISLPISKWRNVLDSEINVITDSNNDIQSNQKCGITTLLNNINSTVTLPRNCVTEGSYNFNLTFDPHFMSEGYLYKEDGLTIDKTNVVNFCITKGAIYHDSINDSFYVFSSVIDKDGKISDETKKISIKFNEQKFFKNTLKMPCVYQIKNTLETGEQVIKSSPTISSIDGIEFPIDKLASGDRLLEVRELDLRSLYSNNLEPIFFSNYYNVDFPIKGITDNNEMFLSYVPTNPTNVTEKLNFIANLMDLQPLKSVFDEASQSYDTTPATDDEIIEFGEQFDNPVLSNISITKPLLEDSFVEKTEATFINRDFSYYKNNLVVRGKINTANPKNIIMPGVDSGLFTDALQNISVGDTLVGAFALGPTGNEEKIQVYLNVNGQPATSATIKYAYFANNQFMAVEEDGTLYYNNNIDVPSVVGNINCSETKIFDNTDNAFFEGDVQMVGWTQDLGWYVEINQAGNTSIICSLDIQSNGTVVLSPAYTSSEKRVYVDLTDGSHTLVGHTIDEMINDKNEDGGWNEYTYNGDTSIKYTYEKSNEILESLSKDGILSGFGKEFVYHDDSEGSNEDILMLYKDVALVNAKIVQSSTDEYVYNISNDFTSEPYFTENEMVINPDGSQTPVSNTLMSRSVLKTDNSGKYTVYAKGRSLFIKSPTSLLEKTREGMVGFENGYSYSGNVSANSYWKHAYAPILNEKMLLTLRSTVVSNKEAVDQLVEMSMMNCLETLYNKGNGVKINGQSIGNNNTTYDKVSEVFTALSGEPEQNDTTIKFNNKVKYEYVVNAMNKAKNTVTKSYCADASATTYNPNNVFPLVVSYDKTNLSWTFKCYGFKLVTETIKDNNNTIGASDQTFAELASNEDSIKNYYVSYSIKDDGPDADYENAYAMFAYYYTYYLCGNAENTDIVLSSNINDVQFTDSNMIVTDTKGNVNTIGLCYLHNKDDIENPNHWSSSAFPQELTYFTVERDLVGVATYKIDGDYMTVQRPSVISKQNTFSVECSYANDDIILLGGYIYSKEQIQEIYDNFNRGSRSDSEYKKWKADRTADAIAVETALKDASNFDKYGTPVLLYSTDKGNSFSITKLESSNGKSLVWEAGTVNTNWYVSGIVFAESEYKVFVKGGSGLDNYYYYISQDDTNGTFDFSATTGSKDMDDYAEISESHQFDLDAISGTNDLEEPSDLSSMGSQSSAIPSGNYRMMFTEGQPYLYIMSSKAVSFGENVMVTSKTNNSLTVSNPLVTKGNTDFDVLLSFNTKKNIKDSILYINMEHCQDYVNGFGFLNVPEVTKVDSSINANRFYSYRELLNPEKLDPSSDSYDPYGYPSVNEDLRYVLYEYDELYNSDTGELTKLPKELTNDYGDVIYLCDNTGNFYIYTDKNTNRHILGTLEMRGQNDLSIFQPAYQTKYETILEAEKNPSIRLNDTDFIGKLILDNSKILSLSFNGDNPYLKISTGNRDLKNDLADFMFIEDRTIEFFNYIKSTTTLISSNVINNDNETLIDIIEGITFNTDVIENGVIKTEQRFTLVSLGKDKKVWYDNLTKSYPLNKKRSLSALASIPYCFRGGLSTYRNVKFSDISDKDNKVFTSPITGVYLSNYGYGGSRNTHKLWENTVPWLVDPDAFLVGENLENTLGEPVYLVDSNGVPLKSYDSEQTRTVGDEPFTVDCGFLGDSEQKDLYVYSNGNNVYRHSIICPKPGTVITYSPISSLTLGTTPFKTNLWVYQSYKLLDIDLDEKGEPMISFKYYGETAREEYKYVPCDDKNVLYETADFSYDLTNKTICYNSHEILEKSFFVESSGKVDVSKLLVTFYVNGEKYEVSFKIDFNYEVHEEYEENKKVRTFNIIGESEKSIYFDSYVIYQKVDDLYSLVRFEFGEDKSNYSNYNNNTSLSLTICDYVDGEYTPETVSVLDISQNCVLSTQFDSSGVNMDDAPGNLHINLQLQTSTPSDFVKVQTGAGESIQIHEIKLPIFVLGDTKTYEDYVVNKIEDGKVTSYDWVRSTYIDDVCVDEISDLKVTYENNNVIVKKAKELKGGDTDSNFIIGTYTEDIPELFTNENLYGYYLSFIDGSVIDPKIGRNEVHVKIVKIDPDNYLSDTVFTNGSYGNIICRKPVYETFKSLLTEKGLVINKGNDSVIYKGNNSITFGAQEENSKSFTLSEIIDVNKLNDGEEHYILIKWLTQSTIKTDISICNSDDDFIEISLEDYSKFTPDRIWFNPDGYPTPPVIIGNSIYNSANNDNYNSNSYKNNNGYSIYRCNENGHLIGFSKITDKSVITSYDTNNDGIPDNVEGYIVGNDGEVESVSVSFELSPKMNVLADAQIPKEPIYTTCQEWFKNDFYIKGKESNPYWQVLSVSSRFNNSKRSWEQYMNVNEYVKATQEMKLQIVNEEDMFICPKKTTSVAIINTICNISPEADVVDKKDGSLSFILDKPAAKYQTEKQFIKYGITAQNPFYESNVWVGKNIQVPYYLDSTYTVCSTKNLADPRDKDSDVQEITEFGLFNKHHQLIAYAVFPPIEYRTSTQHVSFTAYIKQGACVDPKKL